MSPQLLAHSVARLSALLGVLITLLTPRSAHAGGLEYTGQGTQSLARGGAVAARAADPMTLAHNPAGLAELHGNQMLLDLNFAFMKACVDPIGYYGWGAYRGGGYTTLPDPQTGQPQGIPLGLVDSTGPTRVPAALDYYTDPYDTVCLDQGVSPIPQLAFSMRLSDRLGIGFGLIFPSVQPSGAWGNNGTGVIRGDNGDLRPAATRYQLLVANNLGAFPNFGLGYRLADFLRLGVALEYGFIAVDTTAMAPALGGASPHNDLIVHVEAFDYFVPAVTASIHVVPTDAIDLVFAFRWQDKVDAQGKAEFTSGMFDPTKVRNVSTVGIDSVGQNMPWKLRGGIRYASRRVPRANHAGAELDLSGDAVIRDPLQDERWDVELDIEYQANHRNQQQPLDFTDGSRINFQPIGDEMIADAAVPDVVRIQKRWQDQWSVRLGGTANVIPGVLAVSAGTHYETRGIDPAYMQVDFWPLRRLGLHTGITLRMSKSVDVTFAYAHIFQETLVVDAPPNVTRDVIYSEYLETNEVHAIDQRVGTQIGRGDDGYQVLPPQNYGKADGVAALAQNANTTTMDEPPFITNAGRYRSSFDILAVGANFHF